VVGCVWFDGSCDLCAVLPSFGRVTQTFLRKPEFTLAASPLLCAAVRDNLALGRVDGLHWDLRLATGQALRGWLLLQCPSPNLPIRSKEATSDNFAEATAKGGRRHFRRPIMSL
jgi:hypothetical protein